MVAGSGQPVLLGRHYRGAATYHAGTSVAAAASRVQRKASCTGRFSRFLEGGAAGNKKRCQITTREYSKQPPGNISHDQQENTLWYDASSPPKIIHYCTKQLLRNTWYELVLIAQAAVQNIRNQLFFLSPRAPVNGLVMT